MYDVVQEGACETARTLDVVFRDRTPGRGCKVYMFGYVLLYTLVHVSGLQPAHHRTDELRPFINQASSRLSQQSPVVESWGVDRKMGAATCSLGTAPETILHT